MLWSKNEKKKYSQKHDVISLLKFTFAESQR